jgi:DNA-binding XRE family transcriptional regulator
MTLRLANARHTAALLRAMRRDTGGQRTGMSQAELARRLHVTPKTITYRERGQRNMVIDVVIETARVFGYDVALIPMRRSGVEDTGTGWPDDGSTGRSSTAAPHTLWTDVRATPAEPRAPS